tara:strand:- start:6274 stop:6708 length:435 start_codon:yes stop_codon:yes gene_type:complete
VSRSGALDRIDALLGTVSDPTFGAVLRGEPFSIAQTPTVAFWLQSRTVSFLTLKDSSTSTTFTIRAYFRMQSSRDIREDLELNIWDAAVNIDSALRGDSDLAGNVDDMEIGDATTGYTDIGGVAFRTLDIPLTVEIMGEVTITP